jgi:hypothetical protein
MPDDDDAEGVACMVESYRSAHHAARAHCITEAPFPSPGCAWRITVDRSTVR